jgi:uncharacterized membrane protein YphA (DoxX/SURF4 family)
MNAVVRYFQDLTNRTGDAWNRFWFAPRDPYTISVLRIVVGLVTCWWLVVWSWDLTRLFGPQGWLPTERMLEWGGGRGFSLFNLAAETTLLWLVHATALAAAVMFTIGLFTRVTSVLTAILLISYMWRAPLLNAEMELVLVMLVVYLCIGPCGAELSVDRCLAQRREKQASVLAHGNAAEPNAPRLSSAGTISTRLIQVHLTAILISMALAKCRGAVWWNGEAVWWMAARPDSRLVDFTPFLAGKLELVNLWTHSIVLFEFAFAVLVWNRWTRPLMLALSLLVWPGIMLLTGLIGFCLLMLTASLAFVPPHVLRDCCKQARETG